MFDLYGNVLINKENFTFGKPDNENLLQSVKKIQSNLSIADMLYSGHLVIADIFSRNGPNHG